MTYATEQVTRTLRIVRESKTLSQRELSAKSGVPQGHISKIENGAVDLRVSSLVALARILDLELMLVPRKAVSAVRSIVRSSERTTGRRDEESRRSLRELNRLQNTIARLPETVLRVKEVAQLERQVRELRNFRLASPEIDAIRAVYQAVKAFSNDTKHLNAIRQSLSRLRALRNALAQDRSHGGEIESVRPAYRLDEDDHG